MSVINHILFPVRQEWEDRPLRLIIFLAILARMIAVIFSKGFGWFDDHFLIIEAAQSWVDGHDYNRWLPRSGAEGPGGHNLFYAGIHYLLFKGMDMIGFTDPQGKMYIIRLLHAALSMAVVVLGYRIAERMGGKKAARMAGLLLALLWFFPFISVRNLIEFTCVPFLMWGTWILMRKERYKSAIVQGLIAGGILGLAFSMRFQSLIYIGGMGLALLINRRWAAAIATGFGILISSFICLGSIDMAIWGYPYAELIAYIDYNAHHYGEYITGPWYQYLLVIFAILVPPLSFFLVFGMFRDAFLNWRKNLLIFLPVIIFLVFHSYFPNKQERFILPIIPFIIIMGTAGWVSFLEISRFWKKHPRLLKASMAFFWAINIVFLLAISTTYSKRARVESMSYLHRYNGINNILVENSNRANINLQPMYYMGQWATYTPVSTTHPVSAIPQWQIDDPERSPDFFIFEGARNIEQRVKAMKAVFPFMEYETTIHPGMIDRILHWLNPVNANQNAYIYRNTHLHPKKIEK